MFPQHVAHYSQQVAEIEPSDDFLLTRIRHWQQCAWVTRLISIDIESTVQSNFEKNQSNKKRSILENGTIIKHQPGSFTLHSNCELPHSS